MQQRMVVPQSHVYMFRQTLIFGLGKFCLILSNIFKDLYTRLFPGKSHIHKWSHYLHSCNCLIFTLLYLQRLARKFSRC